MSFGKPVISTDVGDAASIIEDAGFIVPPRRPDLLAAAMDQFLSLSSEEYSELSARARRRIETDYLLSDAINKYRDFIECRGQGGLSS